MSNTTFSYTVTTHWNTAHHAGPIAVTKSWGSKQRTYFESLSDFNAWCLESPGDALEISPEALVSLLSIGQKITSGEGESLKTSAGSLAQIIMGTLGWKS